MRLQLASAPTQDNDYATLAREIEDFRVEMLGRLCQLQKDPVGIDVHVLSSPVTASHFSLSKEDPRDSL